MKLSKDKQESLKVGIILIFLVFALYNVVAIIAIAKYLLKLIMPFILGGIIAYALNVLLNIIEEKTLGSIQNKKTKRALGIVMTLAIVISFLTLIVGLIVPELKTTSVNFIENLPIYERNTLDSLSKLGLGEDGIAIAKEYLGNLTNISQDLLQNHKDTIIDSAINIASSVAVTVANAVIAIAFAIYLLAQKETLINQLHKLLRAFLPSKTISNIDNMATTSNKVFTNFVSGQCLEAVIIGILCFIGMLILQIPYSPTISVLVGFTALIPVFGAFIGTIIGAILIFMVDPFKALVFVIFIIILQQFEGNLIYPKVVGKSVGLPSIWVLVAVTIGASVGGILGMLLSVPISSLAYGALSETVNTRLQKKRRS